jgi:hypothetical protein
MVASLSIMGWVRLVLKKWTFCEIVLKNHDPAGRVITPVKNILSKFKYATKTHFSCMLFCPDGYREC